MLFYTVLIAILLLTVSVARFFYRFTIVRINGDSMIPTFQHGQLRIMDRRFNPRDLDAFDTLINLEGRIFVVLSPDGKFIIKRLIHISHNDVGRIYWLEGDNTDFSQDSRHWGYLQEEGFIGEVIGRKEFLSRFITASIYHNTKNSRERKNHGTGNRGNAGKL